jgi:hypothetical protein
MYGYDIFRKFGIHQHQFIKKGLMAEYLSINEYSINVISQRYPDLKYECRHSSRQTSRHIQFFIDGLEKEIHLEYRVESVWYGDKNEWIGRIECHFEGDWETRYGTLIDKLMYLTENCNELNWSVWEYGYRCQHTKKICTLDDLYETLSSMMDMFTNLIHEARSDSPALNEREICVDSRLNDVDKVDIFEKSYKDILRIPLAIPNYQRTYCWDESNVKCLLNDVSEHISIKSSVPYRLGTIILHHHNDRYDILDGQQRLVTLALLLAEIGVKTNLLKEKFVSKQSIEHVAYNKHIIHDYVLRHPGLVSLTDSLLDKIEFSVLVLGNTTLDLAYTFFSNQNSRGVALSDYDLLKAHHLRHIPTSLEQQSRRAAEVWNKMIEDGRIDNDDTSASRQTQKAANAAYVRTLDTYLYRMRKWMRKRTCDDSENSYRIKKEYEAAPIVEEIPPFGERFYFNEPIQGGTHFFSFVEQHLHKYQLFTATEEYRLLHCSIVGSSNEFYRDAIETVLFCYFLKFSTYYLADALVVIMRILLQHRYIHPQATKSSVVKYTGDSELILIIDHATSPTFFLAEARNIAKDLLYPSRQNLSPIRLRMRMTATNIAKKLEHKIIVESFKNLNR